MKTIQLEGVTTATGQLDLCINLEQANTLFEVLLIVQPKAKRKWPVGYFEQTAGALADDPMERPPQGDYEERDEML